VEARLAEVLPDTLSPREALDLLYELKGLADKAG
jgi:DNA mismatch repair protein MutS